MGKMKSEAKAVTNKSIGPILLAPPIFIAHFLEEAPTFVPWFNSHVARGITPGMFWRVNLTALAITLIVVALEWFSRSPMSLVLVVGWFGFLFFANGILHIAGAVVDRGYVPGLMTAIVFYLPYYLSLLSRSVKSKRVAVPVLILSAIIGAIPMLAHGYLILFRGSRLF
jgi:uncharacterized protein with HXXEE motif